MFYLLEGLGLAFLIAVIGVSVDEASRLAQRAIQVFILIHVIGALTSTQVFVEL